MSQLHTTELQGLLDQFLAGHESARDALFLHSLERCRLLTRRMFFRFKRLHGEEETDDVLQRAMIRLLKALEHVRPATVRDFIGLAARQIRWVLRDLVREAGNPKPVHHPDGLVPEHHAPPDPTGEPEDLQQWTEFHQTIDALPNDDREMFDLLYYEALPQQEAAALLGLSVRTIKRRWQQARLRLSEKLRGEWPPMEGDSR